MATQNATDVESPVRAESRETPATGNAPARDNANGRANGNGRGNPETLAKAMGWFSVGLGIAEIVAPRAMSKLIGAPPKNSKLVRWMGVRELTAGVGILAQPRRPEWMWARVSGDIVDLALLRGASQSRRAEQARLTAAAIAVASVTVVDAVCARRLSTTNGAADHVIRFTEAVVVNKPPEECYRMWRDLENLGRFMARVKSVKVTGETTSHWVVEGPAGKEISWDAEITEDVPNEVLAWRSTEGSQISTAGRVLFQRAPRGRGTYVRVLMEYDPPAHGAGALVAKMFGKDPKLAVYKDLRRYKQLLETGETATTQGQSSGRTGGSKLDAMAQI